MKIVLLCKSSEQLSTRLFQSELSLVVGKEHEPVCLTLNTESPLLPGSYYYLMLKGVFPGYKDGSPCVDDSIEMALLRSKESTVRLQSLNTKQWVDWIQDRQQSGEHVW